MQNISQINFEEIDSYIKTEFRYASQEGIQEIKSPTPNYGSITDFIQKSAGYSLSKSLQSDLILRYCFSHRIFDVITVNQILDHYGEKVI